MVALVVVESPTKIRKIQTILGETYRVVASAGHIRDLPQDDLAVDVATMQPYYKVLADKTGMVGKLRSAARDADSILLATDPDREGEAIAWHIAEVLERPCKRVSFTEITESAVRQAMLAPRGIDMALVDAQQARRVLDRFVGYLISPLLWGLRRGLSAGRVQSAALHLLCLRQRDRDAFKVEHHFELEVSYDVGMRALLVIPDDDGKLTPWKTADEALARAKAASLPPPHRVSSIETSQATRRPPPPLTTSAMLQAASSRLDLGSEKTMKLAQQLFEVGLITYLRTDSPTLSDDAVAMAREYLTANHPALLPPKPPVYRSKGGAQEAHEAIRPTTLDESAIDAAPEECWPLWQLIRQRFLASQCRPAQYDVQVVLIEAGEHKLLARGRRLTEPGFLDLLPDSTSTTQDETDSPSENSLPALTEGIDLSVESVDAKRRSTKAPPPFSEASLVAAMEKLQIGRPSTYASIFAVLRRRDYIDTVKGKLASTELGCHVDQLLSQGFPEIVDANFTRICEMRLDEIARGTIAWRKFAAAFHRKLTVDIEKAKPIFLAAAKEVRAEVLAGFEDMTCPRCSRALEPLFGAKTWLKCPDGDCNLMLSVEAMRQANGVKCPKCDGRTVLRDKGFFGCVRYPDCDGLLFPEQTEEARAELNDLIRRATKSVGGKLVCPKCTAPMTARHGKHGPFLRCEKDGCLIVDIKSLIAANGATCPDCGGWTVRRKGAKVSFLSCVKYPDCNGRIWVNKPTRRKQRFKNK